MEIPQTITSSSVQKMDQNQLHNEKEKLIVKIILFILLLVIELIVYNIFDITLENSTNDNNFLNKLNYILIWSMLLVSIFLIKNIFRFHNIKSLDFLSKKDNVINTESVPIKDINSTKEINTTVVSESTWSRNRLNYEIDWLENNRLLYGIGYIVSIIIHVSIVAAHASNWYDFGFIFMGIMAILFQMSANKLDIARNAKWISIWLPIWLNYGFKMLVSGFVFSIFSFFAMRDSIIWDIIWLIVIVGSMASLPIMFIGLIQYFLTKNIYWNRLYQTSVSTVLVWWIVASGVLLLSILIFAWLGAASHV